MIKWIVENPDIASLAAAYVVFLALGIWHAIDSDRALAEFARKHNL